MSKIVLEDRIYIKLKRNIKDIKIKLILLARILYVIIIVEDDNSNNIFCRGRQRYANSTDF